MERPIEDPPLRWLNLFVMPAALLLALRADSFWWSALAAAIVGGTVALVLAVLWTRRFRRQLKHTNPLTHLSAQIQGVTDASVQIRFILMQALSGVVITVVWFVVAVGIVSIIT